METTYEAAGVNIALGERFVERIKTLSKRPNHQKLLRGAGGYAAVYPVTPERLIALTTDGVGTKVLLAHQFNRHHGIGIDLVAMCANDLICVGAKPTLFLDYYATGRLLLETGVELIEGILDGCDQAGMLLVGGETAEMPNVYEASQYDLAGFALGELAVENLLTGDKIQPGQKLIGLPTSGIHSNGLSLARKLMTTDEELESLLTPTQIYVQPVMSALERFGNTITGVAHITGGGWRNLFRLNETVGFEITHPLPILPIFETILAKGIPLEEAYKTFNMGMGMVLIVSSREMEIVQHLNDAGLEAQLVGEVTDAAGMLSCPSQNLKFYQ
jgi:phosphoribosylformylglycinamidine cyclo-ligase